MQALDVLFCLSAGCVLYAYVVYPLLMAFLGRLGAGRRSGTAPLPASVSVVVAAHNEEGSMTRRLLELTDQIRAAGVDGEVIVVSDGSSDATVEVARAFQNGRVRVLELPQNVGKGAALTAGCDAARGELIVFADMRQIWEPEALRHLVQEFADPQVGAVSGDLEIESPAGVLRGVGLYWRFEKWLRRQESRAHSMVGVTGAICAVRRGLFRPIPSGTILDDLYWPLLVAMQGFRVLHVARARAYDQLPESPRDEFFRKVRTLSGNFQLLTRLPRALVPGLNPIWFQFVSHKVARLLVPWALLAMLVVSVGSSNPFFKMALAAQLAFYLLGLLAIYKRSRSALSGAAGSFLLLNGAAWLAFWVWLTGNADKSWRKAGYETCAVERSSKITDPGPALRNGSAISDVAVPNGAPSHPAPVLRH